MPRLVEVRKEKVIGNVPLELPLYTMGAVERYALRDSVQQYDPGIAIGHDDFEHALAEPNYFQDTMQMSFTNGMSGDGFESALEDPAYWNQTMEMGLGAVRRRMPPPPPPPQKVRLQVTEPVKSSTTYGVVGLSALAIIGSVIAYSYFKGKK